MTITTATQITCDTSRHDPILASRAQFIIGLLALIIGTLFYLTEREPETTYFVYIFPIEFNTTDHLSSLFGPVGNNLPSFIHPFSFILLTASLLFCTKKGYLTLTLSWVVINTVFELGQLYAASLRWRMPEWFAGISYLENTENYLLNGTYDPYDLVAICLGAAAAFLVLMVTTKRKEIQ